MFSLARDEALPSQEDFERFHILINEVLCIRKHIDLMRWMQGGLQAYVPHEILIAAWGDFNLGLIHYDVVSNIPGVHSENAMAEGIAPLLTALFSRWISLDRAPLSLNVGDDGFAWASVASQGAISDAMVGMRSALVHGINDQRGRHDCLYVFFSKHPKRRRRETSPVKMLLPYIDTAMRQVELIPGQYTAPGATSKAKVEAIDDTASGGGDSLSEREAEIMRWVAMGKTNGEIGSILNVSSFTVKNHMQRIFKKLDVFNRAQAVANFKRVAVTAAVVASVQDA
jgi:transcriptional regulator EpsA